MSYSLRVPGLTRDLSATQEVPDLVRDVREPKP